MVATPASAIPPHLLALSLPRASIDSPRRRVSTRRSSTLQSYSKQFDSLLNLLSELGAEEGCWRSLGPEAELTPLSPQPSGTSRKGSAGIAAWAGGWGGMMLMLELHRSVGDTLPQVRPISLAGW